MEFNSKMSPLVPSRPSDDMELSRILSSKALPHVNAKLKEKGLGTPWAIKAQLLMHSQLERMPLHSPALESDLREILKMSPYLLQDMLNSMIQFWAYFQSQKKPGPSLDSIEEVMRVSGMLVQALWPVHSPLLQLPHLTTAQLKHFRTKKRNISTIERFASLSPVERRMLVRSLSDEEYSDIMAVCAAFPHITIEAETQVVDDDDTDKVTAGSLVTLSVTLYRSSLLEAGLMQLSDSPMLESTPDGDECDMAVETLGPNLMHSEWQRREGTPPPGPTTNKKVKKVGGSNRKKSKGQAKNKKRTTNPKKAKKGHMAREETVSDDDDEDDEGVRRRRRRRGMQMSHGDSNKVEVQKNNRALKRKKQKNLQENNSSEEEDDDDDQQHNQVEEDEEEWKKLQQSIQKHSKKKFEQASTDSPVVHAPYFPDEKQELWWLYLVDKRKKELICPPQKVAGLMTEHKTDIHFNAPSKTGSERYTVMLRSDSYLDLCFSHDIKFNVGVHEEKEGHSQWADLEEEEEEEEAIEESLSEAESEEDEEESD